MVHRHPGKEPVEVPQADTFECADDDDDQKYFREECFPNEVVSLKQHLDEALGANKALTRQVQEAT